VAEARCSAQPYGYSTSTGAFAEADERGGRRLHVQAAEAGDRARGNDDGFPGLGRGLTVGRHDLGDASTSTGTTSSKASVSLEQLRRHLDAGASDLARADVEPGLRRAAAATLHASGARRAVTLENRLDRGCAV
jgi:hypothetical protein